MYRNTNWVRRQGRWVRGGTQALGAQGAGRAAVGARHGQARRARAAAGAGQARQAEAGRARHAGSGRGRGGWPRRVAGPAGCALGALGLFLTRFDSVLFLSQFLDIVREPGS